MRRILLCLLIVMHALPSAAFLGNSKLYRYCVRNEWNSLVKRADSKDAFNHNKYQQSFYSFVEPCIDRIIKAHNMNALFAILKITNKNLTSNQIKSLIMADKINEIKFLVSTEKINLFYSVKLGDIYSLILKSNKAAEWTEFVLSLIAENNSEAKNKFIDINERLSSHKTFLGHFLEKGHIGAARLLIEAGASIYEALVYEYTKDHWMLIDIDEEQKQSLYEMLADYVDKEKLISFLNKSTQTIQSLLLRFLSDGPKPHFNDVRALKDYFEHEALKKSFPLSLIRPVEGHFGGRICVLDCENNESSKDWRDLACGHTVCVKCLQQSNSIHEKKPLKCLALNCGYFLSLAEKSYLDLPSDIISSQETILFHEFIQNIPGYEHCRQRDCPGYSLSQHHYEQGTTHIECVVCKIFQCIKCGAYHPSIKCPNETEDQKFIESQIAAGQLVRCPFCKMPAAKIDGCLHVTCAQCKRPYNWVPQKQPAQ